MKIAVVGSEGYLGSSLVPRLGGHDVLRIDAGVWRTPPEGVLRLRSTYKIRQRLERFEPDHVVWLAALAHDPTGMLSDRAMHENNTAIPSEVLDALQCPATVISSLSVYSPVGTYPATKRFLEERLMRGCQWRNRINILRFGTLFGEVRDCPAAFRPHLLLNRMTIDAVWDRKIQVSNPALRRPVLHVGVAAAAIIEDIFEPGPRGEIRNELEHCDTLAGFAAIVAEELGAEVVTGAWKDLDERDYGWNVTSKGNVRAEVQRLAEWVRYHGRFDNNQHEALRAWHDRYYS